MILIFLFIYFLLKHANFSSRQSDIVFHHSRSTVLFLARSFIFHDEDTTSFFFIPSLLEVTYKKIVLSLYSKINKYLTVVEKTG